MVAALLLVSYLPTVQGLSQEGDPYVSRVEHSPVSPAPGESFNISITLNGELELAWTKVYVCSITEGFCGAPVPAESRGQDKNTYSNFSYLESKAGHVLGFKFLFKTVNDTYYKFPSANTSYPGLEIVQLMEAEYFKVQIQGNYTPMVSSDDDDAVGSLPGLRPGVVLVTLVMVARVAPSRTR